MWEKLKSWLENDTIYIAGLLVLVGVGSFGLGRFSVAGHGVMAPAAAKVQLIASSTPPTPIVATTSTPLREASLQSAAAVITATAPMVPATGTYVASKSGTKYHLVTCPGAKQIKEANKIYFETAEAAQAAGYTPAANCPNL